MVIGDVSGHGFDSAIVMAQTRALVRAAARASPTPARILSTVNALLAPDLGENRFVGMIVVDIDPRTRAIRWANAGHVPGYVIDRAGHIKTELASTGVVLGLFADAAFATTRGRPSSAATCSCCSRTVSRRQRRPTAPCAAPSGRWTSCARTRTAAPRTSSRRSATPSELFADGSAQHDDVTAIVCRVLDLE